MKQKYKLFFEICALSFLILLNVEFLYAKMLNTAPRH
jgi:hypothetical protein